LVRGGDFNYYTKNTIRMLRKIPNAQVTLTRGITWGLQLTLLKKRYFLPDFPVIAEEVF
jgi:hypothetical protein